MNHVHYFHTHSSIRSVHAVPSAPLRSHHLPSDTVQSDPVSHTTAYHNHLPHIVSIEHATFFITD